MESIRNEFIFTPTSNSSFQTVTIIDDSVLEFDELLIATFDFGPVITDNWNARKGEPSTTYILIRDNDCEKTLSYINTVEFTTVTYFN